MTPDRAPAAFEESRFAKLRGFQRPVTRLYARELDDIMLCWHGRCFPGRTAVMLLFPETTMATTLEPSQSSIQSAPCNNSGPAPGIESLSAWDRLMFKVFFGCFAFMATIMLLDLFSGLWLR